MTCRLQFCPCDNSHVHSFCAVLSPLMHTSSSTPLQLRGYMQEDFLTLGKLCSTLDRDPILPGNALSRCCDILQTIRSGVVPPWLLHETPYMPASRQHQPAVKVDLVKIICRTSKRSLLTPWLFDETPYMPASHQPAVKVTFLQKGLQGI